MLKPLTSFMTGIFGILLAVEVHGSDFHSPRTSALGGAGHASPLLSDSIYLNPSFGSFLQTHALSFNYLIFGQGTVETPLGMSDYYGHNINISVLDGTPESIFQAGASYTRRDDGSFIHVVASKSIIPKLSTGLGVKFFFPNDASGTRVIEGTFSVTGIPISWFQTALIIDNIFEAGKDRGFYREVVLGTKFNVMSIFMIYADPHWAPGLPEGESTLGWEAGLEFPFFTDFFLRVGNFKSATVPFEARRGDGYALGVGWLGPKLSIDYSISRVIQPISAIAHNFGATIYF